MRSGITKHVIFAARKSQLCIGSRLGKYNITAAEEPFFMAIQHHEGSTQEELTSLVGVDKAATTRAIRSLEKKDFLIRKQDEKDHRQNRIYATERALNMGPEVHRELLHLNDEIMEGISEEEQKIMYQALLQMEKNLKQIK